MIKIDYLSTEQLKKNDETLPQTGASQEAGWYYSETENGVMFVPVGPFGSYEEARDEVNEMVA